MPTIIDVAEFVRENKGYEKAFKGWTEDDLLATCVKALRDKTLGWSINERTGKLNGIVICKANHEIQSMHIIGIVTSEPGIFRSLLDLFIKLYPKWNLTGKRRGMIVNFKTSKIDKLIK